jgi:MFS family permease
VGPAWCFLINAISYLGSIVGVFLMKNVKALKRARRDQSMLKQIGEGFSHVWGSLLMRNMLLMTAISQMFLMPYTIFFPVYATHIFKVGTKGQGVMMMSVGVGALAAAVILSSFGHRLEQKTFVFVGAILAPAGLVAFSLCHSFHASLICLTAIGMGMMLFMASSNTIMQMGAPAELGGRVMSLRALVMFGVAAAGSYMMGRLSEVRHIVVRGMLVHIDVQGTILIGAVVGLASALYFAAASWRVRERRGLAVTEEAD